MVRKKLRRCILTVRGSYTGGIFSKMVGYTKLYIVNQDCSSPRDKSADPCIGMYNPYKKDNPEPFITEPQTKLKSLHDPKP